MCVTKVGYGIIHWWFTRTESTAMFFLGILNSSILPQRGRSVSPQKYVHVFVVQWRITSIIFANRLSNWFIIYCWCFVILMLLFYPLSLPFSLSLHFFISIHLVFSFDCSSPFVVYSYIIPAYMYRVCIHQTGNVLNLQCIRIIYIRIRVCSTTFYSFSVLFIQYLARCLLILTNTRNAIDSRYIYITWKKYTLHTYK